MTLAPPDVKQDIVKRARIAAIDYDNRDPCSIFGKIIKYSELILIERKILNNKYTSVRLLSNTNLNSGAD